MPLVAVVVADVEVAGFHLVTVDVGVFVVGFHLVTADVGVSAVFFELGPAYVALGGWMVLLLGMTTGLLVVVGPVGGEALVPLAVVP